MQYLRWRNRDETVIALPNCLCRLDSDGPIAVFVHHSVISRVGYSTSILIRATCRRTLFLCATIAVLLLLIILLLVGASRRLADSLRFGGKSCDCCDSGGRSELVVGRVGGGHLGRGGNPPTITTTFLLLLLLLVHTRVLRCCIIQHVLLLELRQWDFRSMSDLIMVCVCADFRSDWLNLRSRSLAGVPLTHHYWLDREE